jgi:DNA modification methylase
VVHSYFNTIYSVFWPFLKAIDNAENMTRKCFAVEIHPPYCAVAIQRWTDLTGEKPILIK